MSETTDKSAMLAQELSTSGVLPISQPDTVQSVIWLNEGKETGSYGTLMFGQLTVANPLFFNYTLFLLGGEFFNIPGADKGSLQFSFYYKGSKSPSEIWSLFTPGAQLYLVSQEA